MPDRDKQLQPSFPTEPPVGGPSGRAPREGEAAARLFHHARREAILVLTVFALTLVWTVGYCYLRGYQHAPDSWVVQAGLAVARTDDNFHQIWGLPDWVLFGILVPWLLSTAFTIGFALVGMKDDDLGAEAEEGAGHGH